jgi:dimeric dUTPase (all-alpha-NTP-PPase superfamily)
MEYIKQMFNLQNQLNNSTCGSNWRDGKTESGNVINWNRCIYMEAAEAIDSFTWKHWKDLDGESDWVNARVEVIDIWHFLMSEIMHENKVDLVDGFIIKDAVENPDKNQITEILEKIIVSAASTIHSGESNVKHLSDLFFELLSEIGINIEDLYANYLVKNQLNVFRQNNGYKDGTYIKNWDAVEDNVIALNIMQGNPDLKPDELYRELEKEYANIPENRVVEPEEDKCVFDRPEVNSIID